MNKVISLGMGILLLGASTFGATQKESCLALRKLTGGQVAYSVWQLPDGNIETVRISQEDYNDFAITRAGQGEIAGKPSPDAIWLMAGGGMKALDTRDGWPSIGDCWEDVDDSNSKVLRIATGDGVDFQYQSKVASDPKAGKVSEITGIKVTSKGNRDFVKEYDINNLSGISVRTTPALTKENLSGEIYNHRSISFDAATGATGADVSFLSFAHTVANQSNRIILGGLTWSDNTKTVDTFQYNSVVMTAIDSANANNTSIAVKRLVAPATGSNTVQLSLNNTSAFIVGMASSYYGVDQTTPLGTSAKNNSTTGNPSTTVTSATGELVVDFVADVDGASQLTAGAGQTERGRAVNVIALEISDENGAASVSMDWTHTSGEWNQIAFPLKPLADATPSRKMRLFEGFTVKLINGKIIIHQQ